MSPRGPSVIGGARSGSPNISQRIVVKGVVVLLIEFPSGIISVIVDNCTHHDGGCYRFTSEYSCFYSITNTALNSVHNRFVIIYGYRIEFSFLFTSHGFQMNAVRT